MLIKDLKVGVGQKINLGNFETRDIYLEASGTLIDGESFIEEAIKLRTQLLEAQRDYYVSTKDAINGVTDEVRKIQELILKMPSKEESNDIKNKILAVKEEKAKNMLITEFNKRLLSLEG